MTQEQPQPATPSSTLSSHAEKSLKLVWNHPTIRSLGQITTQTGQSGKASEFDSFSNHRK